MKKFSLARLLEEVKDKGNGLTKMPKRIPAQSCRPAWMKSVVKKVAKDINNPNPPSQKQMAI